MSVIVYTCVTGGYDNIRPPLASPEPGVRFICFTDVPVLLDEPPWEFRPVHRVTGTSGYSARRTACLPKMLPHLMLPECEYSIWHDGNFRLSASASRIAAHAADKDLALHVHPSRDCVYQEADALLAGGFGDAALIHREVVRYRGQGHPEHAGLWACGMVVRRHTSAAAALNERWWGLYTDGSELDQMSFAVARRVEGIDVGTLPGDVFRSPYMSFDGWHAKWCSEEDKSVARPERRRVADRVDRLRGLAGDGGYTWEVN